MPLRSLQHLRDLSQRLALKAGGLLLLIFITACAAPFSIQKTEYDPKIASRLFTNGFSYVTEFYIEEIDVSRLALAGMDNLSTIDPELEIIDSGNSLTVTYAGEPVSRYGYPSTLDNKAWARLTSSVISEAETRSSDFQHATGEQIYQAVFDGILGELDKFSRYSRPDQANNNRDNRNGFGGLGIRYIKDPKGAHILSVMENTPAESVGLQPGDIITKVGNKDISQLSETSITHMLKGPEGSSVRITVLRDPEKPQTLNYEIIRKRIVVQTVNYSAHDNIAYIQISGFNRSTTSNMRRKVRKAQKEMGKDLKGYILDLRNNGGGLLREAVNTADLFISSGPIVSTRGRHPDSHQYSAAHSQDIAKGLPIIVLINSYSASSSEILAAGLQDSGRAIIIGSNSYGKGTVQKVLQLPNRAEIAITWARFHAPSGYAIHKRGIIPNICTTTGDTDTVDDVIALLKSGSLPISSDIRSSSPSLDDETALDNIKSSCPQSAEPSELERDIAELLLLNPSLFSLAKGHSSPVTTDVIELDPSQQSNAF
ncbi:hypothetical protein A9Q97_04160 [Rhodospirillales bacterium 47_12_T64]|nr:hypothetical protein A9Q97_04160 [Rhodospirillales bacterium 47_12_T64]